MPTNISSVKTLPKTEPLHCRQVALFDLANNDSFQAMIKSGGFWNQIAGIDEQGRFVGLNAEEAEKNYASYLENIQVLCKGLICKQASYFQDNLHQLCTIEPPNAAYKPELSFIYPYSSRSTVLSRTLINEYQEFLALDIAHFTFQISFEQKKVKNQHHKQVIQDRITKNFTSCKIGSNDVTVLKFTDTDDFFIATEGNIEKCHSLTWGGLIILMANSQLPKKEITEYNVEGIKIDQTTDQVPNSTKSRLDSLSRKRLSATPSIAQNSLAQKRHQQYHNATLGYKEIENSTLCSKLRKRHTSAQPCT